MNIFFLHQDPNECAKLHVDKHVVKMILEYAQLLSTAHRILDGTVVLGKSKSGRNQKQWELHDDRNGVLYKATHINHPCALWARQSSANYYWLHSLLVGLLCEYHHRYKKLHACEKLVDALNELPNNINYGVMTFPALAMPDNCKVSENAVQSYRNYYNQEKRDIASWKRREVPSWFIMDDK